MFLILESNNLLEETIGIELMGVSCPSFSVTAATISLNSKAFDLITKMIHVKIKYHEDKILKDNSEEDIKMREAKIKQLQKDLYNTRNSMENNKSKIKLQAQINFNN